MATSRPGAARPRRETILLVEDEPAVRTLFVRALSREGYEIHEARNGREAVELFDRIGEKIDLLVTDLRMPLMGGIELAQRLRTRQPAMKLLCVSGYPGHEVPTLEAEFLAKPFSRDALVTKVREILDKK
jgi:two-component system cell cycle sensor histidine kinase/response regulator CckA